MNFKFVPLKLNRDLEDFKDNIEYVDTDNGIDLYRAREGVSIEIFGLLLKQINFYFYERKLITIYLHLEEGLENAELVKKTIENTFKRSAQIIEINTGVVYGWKTENEFLGLVNDKKLKTLYLYYSTNEHNVFSNKF